MQDLPTEPAFVRGLYFLSTSRLREPSGLALSLAAVALRVAGRPADDVEDRLAADVAPVLRLGNMQTMAMVCYALTSGTHHAEALRV